MKATILHVITSLGSGRAERMLTRLMLADRGPRASRQIVVSLTDSGIYGHTLQDAGVELHCLGLAKLSRTPVALFRLIILMRSIRPDVVMTWLYHAHFIGTVAGITSGIGARRVVWNLSGSNPEFSGHTGTTHFIVRLLAWLSRLPRGIVPSSRSGQRAYEALGYRPRRWFRLPDITREDQLQRALETYRQLWRFAGSSRRRGRGRLHRAFPQLEYRSAQVRRLLLTKTTFIAVTGSCGKTVTTSLAGAILATDGSCYVGNYRNILRWSVRAVLSVAASTKYLIQEVSGHLPGAIAMHVRVLRPHVAIVTTIGSDHYTNFRSLEATAREKGQLVESLPMHGTAILNADDPHVRAMAARTRARVLTFGLSPDADIRATEVSSSWPDRLTLTVIHGHKSVHIQTRFAGEHWTTSILAAIACGVVCGIDLRTCAKAVERFNPRFGRYSIHAKPGGPIFVLDRKASFWTIATGLTFLARARAARKTAVFGAISDIPGRGSQKYRKVAREALEVADRVVFVGSNAASVSKLLRQREWREKLFAFQTSYQASAFLAEDTLPEELIYIKAPPMDHLERLMLSQLDQVICWWERCGTKVKCQACSNYHRPHPPPFGLSESESPVVSPTKAA